jgi:hypothetical protein
MRDIRSRTANAISHARAGLSPKCARTCASEVSCACRPLSAVDLFQSTYGKVSYANAGENSYRPGEGGGDSVEDCALLPALVFVLMP